MALIPADVVVPESEPGGRIFQTLTNTLATVEAIYKRAGVKLPEVRFVSDGQVAYDNTEDGILAIAYQALRPGRPGAGAAFGPIQPGTVFSLEVGVHLIRPVPNSNDQGEPPMADEITASARELVNDWSVFVDGAMRGRGLGSEGLPGDFQGAPYRSLMVQEIVPYGPSGNVGGMLATCVVELV